LRKRGHGRESIGVERVFWQGGEGEERIKKVFWGWLFGRGADFGVGVAGVAEELFDEGEVYFGGFGVADAAFADAEALEFVAGEADFDFAVAGVTRAAVGHYFLVAFEG
jgi:hypothetical protein